MKRLHRLNYEFVGYLFKNIDDAKNEIIINTYIFKFDDFGRELIERLKEAVKRQVKVTMVIDAIGSIKLNEEEFRNIKELGINLIRFNPPFNVGFFQLGRRLHQKIILIDKKHAFVGGANLSSPYYGGDEKNPWLDYFYYLDGAEVNLIKKYICYESTKNYQLFKLPVQKEVSDSLKIDILIQDYSNKKREISKEYFTRIKSANSRICIITPYFFPGRRMIKALKTASARGVDVQIIFGKYSDFWLINWAAQTIYHELLKSKINIKEWNKSILHGKLAIIDDWATVGSYNLDFVSQFGNLEMNVARIDQNITEFSNEFEWVSKKSEIINESVLSETRSVFDRIRNKLAYIVIKTIKHLSLQVHSDLERLVDESSNIQNQHTDL